MLPPVDLELLSLFNAWEVDEEPEVVDPGLVDAEADPETPALPAAELLTDAEPLTPVLAEDDVF